MVRLLWTHTLCGRASLSVFVYVLTCLRFHTPAEGRKEWPCIKFCSAGLFSISQRLASSLIASLYHLRKMPWGILLKNQDRLSHSNAPQNPLVWCFPDLYKHLFAYCMLNARVSVGDLWLCLGSEISGSGKRFDMSRYCTSLLCSLHSFV